MRFAVILTSAVLAACNADGSLPGMGGDLAGVLDSGVPRPDLTAPPDLAGPQCAALHVRGGTSHAIAKYSASLDPPAGVTIEMWVLADDGTNPCAGAGSCELASHVRDSGGGATGYQLSLTPSVEFVAAGQPLPFNRLPPRQWSHVAGVYDSTSDTYSGWWDGTQAIVGSGNGALPPLAAPSVPLTVGTGFNGWIRELRVTHGARYTQAFPPPARFEDDPYTAVLLHFDELGQATARDRSMYGNDAALLEGATIDAPPTCP